MKICTIRNAVKANVGYMKDLKIQQYGTFYRSVGKTGHHNVHVMGILNRYDTTMYSSWES
jgi:hypothetical protein